MTKHLKRHLSILLAALIVMSVLATFPLTAGAIADTSDPWIFEVDGTTQYHLDGKWVRFGDEDFQLTGNGVFHREQKPGTTGTYILKYGDTTIAQYRSETLTRHFGTTVYVTGYGNDEHPYVFTPNMLFYKSANTIAGGATVAIGYENVIESETNIAVPGDGFKHSARLKVGAKDEENKVLFTKNNTESYIPFNHSSGKTAGQYVGVNATGYGWSFSSGTINEGFDFSSGSDTLYYLGRKNDEGKSLYIFSETVNKRTDFDGTNKVICTVTWENDDGTVLKTLTYNLGETPSTPQDLETPTKTAGTAYTYTFKGWNPAYDRLEDDTSYVAQYDVEVTGDLSYSVSKWIFSTNDNRVYNEENDLEGKCYRYTDANGDVHDGSFPQGGGSFSVDEENHQLLLCGKVVADIDTSKPYKTFANTVYVECSGTEMSGTVGDPFIFHPNYVYGTTGKTNVKDGVSVAIDEAHKINDKESVANPGDGFTAMSRIRVYDSTEQSNKNLYKIQFLERNGLYRPSRYLLGVGETTYGYRYQKTKALPFSFELGDTLYYFETTGEGIHKFSETEPPLKHRFSPSDTTTYTVTWKNYDGAVLDKETYYVYDTPTYKGATPVREPSDGKEYTFSNWTPAVSPVTGDVEYTATFTEADRTLFKGYTLTLNGDIGLNFWLNVSEDEVTQDDGTTVEFKWNVKGHTEPKTANAKLTAAAGGYKIVDGHKYYKATCWVAAAEMAYDIHATAYINGVEQSETNTYSVKSYGMVVLNSPDGTFDKQALLTDLVKKMLDYGAKAQTLFDRADVSLANSGLVDNLAYTMSQTDNDKSINENITYTRSDMRDGTEESLGLKYLGTSIIYLSKTSLRHYYQVVDEDLFNNVKGTVEGGFVYGVNGDAIYFEKQDIAAADIDTIQTFTIGGKSFDFSVLDYIKLVLNSDLSDNDKKLAMATYWYNKAADAYFTP